MAWHLLTRLGEAQLLLPMFALALLWLLRQPAQARTARVWLAGTAVVTAVTTASKVAFLGFGWGVPSLDFTGFSGHAMFSAAIWPPLLWLAARRVGPAAASAGQGGPASARRGALLGAAAGYALAAAVAGSRVAVGAHSWSEVLSGFALGSLASGLLLAASLRTPPPRTGLGRWAPMAAAALALAVWAAPPPRTHDWVTRLALVTSGRSAPFHRWMLHHRPGPTAPLGARNATPSLQLR